MWRTRAGSAAGTSSGKIGATCRHRCAAIRPSSRNAFRRRNWPSSRVKGKRLKSRQADRMASKSIPIRCRSDRTRRMRWRPRDARQPAVAIPALVMKISARAIGRSLAPGIRAFGAIRRAVGGAVPLRFGRQFLSGPARERGRFRMAHIHRPGRRQRNRPEHRADIPTACPDRPRRTSIAAARNADARFAAGVSTPSLPGVQ